MTAEYDDEVRDVVSVYDRNARAFAEGYESLPFETAHTAVLDRLPTAPAAIQTSGGARWSAVQGSNL